MDLDIDIPSLITPVPNEEFCIYRQVGYAPQYLERYGIILHNPDTYFKPSNCVFFIWSVFDLEDLGFKVFLDGSYNYKVEHGAEQGVRRSRTDEYAPSASDCPRTKKNLWFISYRINQLPSDHVFYPQRPPSASNIPPASQLTQRQLLDARAAKRREVLRLGAELREPAQPTVSTSPPGFPIEELQSRTSSDLDQKYDEINTALKVWGEEWAQTRSYNKDGANPENKKTFDQFLERLLANLPMATKALKIEPFGIANIMQKRAAIQYYHEMATVSYWIGKNNNAATKITRAYYGMPVEPLTPENILNAGKGTSDARMAIERSIPDLERKLAQPGPLDFLDQYTGSLNGEPGIRAKPKAGDLAYKRLPSHLDDLLYEFKAGSSPKASQICQIVQPEPYIEEDNDFNFVEYCQNLDEYRQNDDGNASLRGGGLAPVDSEDEDMYTDEADRYLGDIEVEDAYAEMDVDDSGLRGGALPKGKGQGGKGGEDATSQEQTEEMIGEYEKRFVDEYYQVGVESGEWTNETTIAYMKLAGIDQDETMLENYGPDAGGRVNPTQVKSLIDVWIKDPSESDCKSVYDLIKEGRRPPQSVYDKWKRIDNARKQATSQDQSKPVENSSGSGNSVQMPNTAQPPKPNLPGTPGSDTIFIRGVGFSPRQFAAIAPTIERLKKAASQPRPPIFRQGPPSRPSSQLGVPNFTIPFVQEMDDEETEEMALAELELNGSENDTPQAYTNRIKRYKEAVVRAERRKQAKQSFIMDRSVHSEADLPTVPQFGRTLEEKIDFDGAPPTLYLKELNMKKIREVQASNRQMENVLLGREEYCGTCDTYIHFENAHHKDNHYRGHRSVVTSCGFCGVSFSGMRPSERTAHLKTHANTKYGAQDQLRPYRNIVKKAYQPGDDVMMFCTQCGEDLNTFVTEEQMWCHIEDCKAAHPNGSTVDFCNKCGQDQRNYTPHRRNSHANVCTWKHLLGAYGRDYHVWNLADENTPGGVNATEDARARIYCHLMTLTGIPGREDVLSQSANAAFGKKVCKFYGCDAELAELAKRDKLMEHLGNHLGKGDLKKYPCPINACPQDFAPWRQELLKWAEAQGVAYDDGEKDLAVRILKHMKSVHQAPCSDEDEVDRTCLKCLMDQVESGEYGPDVVMGERGTQQQAPQSRVPHIEAGSYATPEEEMRATIRRMGVLQAWNPELFEMMYAETQQALDEENARQQQAAHDLLEQQQAQEKRKAEVALAEQAKEVERKAEAALAEKAKEAKRKAALQEEADRAAAEKKMTPEVAIEDVTDATVVGRKDTTGDKTKFGRPRRSTGNHNINTPAERARKNKKKRSADDEAEPEKSTTKTKRTSK